VQLSSKMLSEHTVAERLAAAKRRRMAGGVINTLSSGLTLPVDRLHPLLARTLWSTLTNRRSISSQSTTRSAGAAPR